MTVKQLGQNWEEQGDIRAHTFKYGNALKSEFYYRVGGKWPEHPFVVIGIDLNSFRVFFRCVICLYDSHWEDWLRDNRQRIKYYREASLRLYNREVNVVRRGLGFPER